MYSYFIDDWVEDKKYKKDLDKLDLWLTQHGIVGRKIKLGRLHDLEASIEDCISGGARTIVAVGNDSTASRVLNAFLKLQPPKNINTDAAPARTASNSSVAFAVLPIGKSNLISQCLGARDLPGAVDILTKRKIATIDLGKLNDRHYFITAAIFPKKVSLGFLSYKVSSLHKDHQISVCNTNIFSAKGDMQNKGPFNPLDGRLEAVIAYRPRRPFWSRFSKDKSLPQEFLAESIFPIKNILVHGKQKTLKVLADVEKNLSSPVSAEIIPQAIDVVVGEKCSAWCVGAGA